MALPHHTQFRLRLSGLGLSTPRSKGAGTKSETFLNCLHLAQGLAQSRNQTCKVTLPHAAPHNTPLEPAPAVMPPGHQGLPPSQEAASQPCFCPLCSGLSLLL